MTELVARARVGDVGAREALVEQLQGLVWYALASFGLSREDREDVAAGTFCRLFERLDTIRDPSRLPGWIVTTARNEAHTLLRARGKMVLTDEEPEVADLAPAPDDRILDLELSAALWAAFSELPSSCRQLLGLLIAVPPLPYRDIEELLGMPLLVAW